MKQKTITVSDKNNTYQFVVTVDYPVNVGDPVTELVADVCAQTLAEDVGSRVRATYRARTAKGETLTQDEVDQYCREATLRVGGNRLDPIEVEMRNLAELAARAHIKRTGIKVDLKELTAKILEAKSAELRKRATANLKAMSEIDVSGY